MKTPVDDASSPAKPTDQVLDGWDDADLEPKRELSVVRIAVVLLLVVAVVASAAYVLRQPIAAKTAGPTGPVTPTWFAPYVDTTLTPTAQFQDPGPDPAHQVALGFVVADPKQGCTPSWGGAYGLDAAASALNLDRRIAQLRSQGGDALVSFGGQANTELAVSCTSVSALTTAYSSVLSRYAMTTADFDVEGAALADTAATQRRATALASLQGAARAKGTKLAIWLTLPVATSGLQPDALAVVGTTLASGVSLAGVNVMAMNFGTPETDMGGAVHSSLTAAHEQLTRLYAKYGIPHTSTAVWNRMGATVMIGQNDSAGEIYTTSDAQQLTADAHAWHLGRVSMWSFNRDQQCGGAFAIVGVQSNTCSGTTQAANGFSTIFSALPGTLATAAGASQATPSAVATVPDNPATSPYPLWQPGRPYETGYKVVRQGNVYQAKWYNSGQDPAAQYASSYASPWQIIGPVLPGEKPPPLPTVAAGTYPAWSPTATYQAGARVLYQRLPYQAKWYNSATSPGAEDADPSSSPWLPLFTVPGEPS